MLVQKSKKNTEDWEHFLVKNPFKDAFKRPFIIVASSLMSLVVVTCESKGVRGYRPQDNF